MSTLIPSFEQFVKNPIVGVLVLSLVAVSYLYIDNKKTTNKVISDLQARVKTLEDNEVRRQREQQIKDSLLIKSLTQQLEQHYAKQKNN